MKSKQIFLAIFVSCLALAACRSERKSSESVPKKDPRSESGSSPPPPASSLAIDPSPEAVGKTEKNQFSPGKAERTAEEMLAAMDEEKQAEVFAVPVPEQVALERAEAWEKLTTSEAHMILKKDQYLYADALINRYRDAPAIERLVFWRLIDLRLNDQGVSSSSVILGDGYWELRRSMYPKLMAMLYSAIGETPETLQDFLAIRKGIAMLKEAAPDRKPPIK